MAIETLKPASRTCGYDDAERKSCAAQSARKTHCNCKPWARNAQLARPFVDTVFLVPAAPPPRPPIPKPFGVWRGGGRGMPHALAAESPQPLGGPKAEPPTTQKRHVVVVVVVIIDNQ